MPASVPEARAFLKIQETMDHHSPGPDQDVIKKKAEMTKLAEKLVASLTDYICDHVTESLKPIQAVIEKKTIIRALSEVGRSQKEAARKLGITYTTLNPKVKKHKICIKKIVSNVQAGLLELSGDKMDNPILYSPINHCK